VAKIKTAHVAGTFYPDDPQALSALLDDCFAQDFSQQQTSPKAMIVPHAGHIYSGPTAAFAYHALESIAAQIKHVLLIAPSHYHPLSCVAACSAQAFATPLGNIDADTETLHTLHQQGLVQFVDEAFEQEHALEVHFPFLQRIIPTFKLTALLAGYDSVINVYEILLKLWQPLNTMIIISSDLSHFHPYQEAKKHDQKTAEAILSLQAQDIQSEDACGAVAIRALLLLAKEKSLQAELLDMRNSGDTAGDPDRVVGYGAFQFV
jgi:AmmeMemoRadiSam system protein B